MFLRSALLALLLLAGCAPPPPEAAAPGTPAGFPHAFYRQAAAQGVTVFTVDGAHSQIRVRVYKAGPLAGFGHDHVIMGRGVQGYVAPSLGRADLYLPLGALEVADDGLSAADAAATRHNMLDKVLEAPRYPFVVVHAGCSAPCAVLAAQVTLHGVTRTLNLPVEWKAEGGRLEASGSFRIRHRDFGLVPYSLLGGALRVDEPLDLSFRIQARENETEAGAAVGN